MTGSCECGNEYSGSMKRGDFYLALHLLASQEGFCSMDLFADDLEPWLMG